MSPNSADDVLRLADVAPDAVRELLARYGIELCVQASGEAIKGSYWGDSEAGIIGSVVYARPDTPVHSLLHESCHLLCMDEERRAVVRRDAGGDDLEESAVCYLQILLAGQIDGVGSARLMRDMDAWGYSFRLGRTERWWQEDAADARAWLQQRGLLSAHGSLLYPYHK